MSYRSFRRGYYPRQNHGDDLRNKINRLRTEREIETHSKNEHPAYNEDEEDSISLSSLEEEAPVKNVPKRTRSRSPVKSQNKQCRSESPPKRQSRSKSKSREKSSKKHKKEKKKKKKSKHKDDKITHKKKMNDIEYDKISSESEDNLSKSPMIMDGASQFEHDKGPCSSRKSPSYDHNNRRERSRSPPRYSHPSNEYSRHHRHMRRRFSRSSFYNSTRGKFVTGDDWSDNVDKFLKNINSKEKDLPEIQEPQEPSCDNITLTPLMKFVAKKLNNKKNLHLEGPFQYSLLSVLSRSEWVAARTVQLLEESGFNNDWLYDTAAIKGGTGLKETLIEALHSGKINIGLEKESLNQTKKQIIYVIALIVKYFTCDGDEDQDDQENIDDEMEDTNYNDPRKEGLGAVLEQIIVSQPPPPPGILIIFFFLNFASQIGIMKQLTLMDKYISSHFLQHETFNKTHLIRNVISFLHHEK